MSRDNDDGEEEEEEERRCRNMIEPVSLHFSFFSLSLALSFPLFLFVLCSNNKKKHIRKGKKCPFLLSPIRLDLLLKMNQ